MPERRMEWERALGAARWSCIGWPAQYGGRDATLAEQVIFAEEYARARAPARIGHMGIELAGPTILAFGTEAQKQRFLLPIARGEEFWCQGYSEPNAGSDLANVRTRAALVDGAHGREWAAERAEGMDLARAVRRLGLRRVPHGRWLARPPRPVLSAGADAPAGSDHPPHPPAHR